MIIKRINIFAFFLFFFLAAWLFFKEFLECPLELVFLLTTSVPKELIDKAFLFIFERCFDFEGGIEKILEIWVLVLVDLIIFGTQKIIQVSLFRIWQHLIGLLNIAEIFNVGFLILSCFVLFSLELEQKKGNYGLLGGIALLDYNKPSWCRMWWPLVWYPINHNSCFFEFFRFLAAFERGRLALGWQRMGWLGFLFNFTKMDWILIFELFLFILDLSKMRFIQFFFMFWHEKIKLQDFLDWGYHRNRKTVDFKKKNVLFLALNFIFPKFAPRN